MTAPPRIRAVIFDLDGTLADTESQKARAYVDVITGLQGADKPDPRIMPLYERVVGTTDEAMARAAVDELDLAASLERHITALGVDEPWEALHRLRVERYLASHGASDELARHAFGHNVDLLRQQHAAGRAIAVATSSPQREAERVVHALGVRDLVEHVVGRDRVSKTKPDPEIYLFTAELLAAPPAGILVVEDTPLGVQAALAAGMACIAVANSLTGDSLRRQNILEQPWIAYRPDEVSEVAARRIAATEHR